MATPLTSWKEIARYLGKGVRTVQRWERDLALPIRRPTGHNKGMVIALADEIDDWLRQQHKQQCDNLNQEIERLRAAVAELRDENQALRAKLDPSNKSQKTRKAEPVQGAEIQNTDSRPIKKPHQTFDTP